MQSNFPKIPFLLSILFFAFSVGAFLFSYHALQKNNDKAEMAITQWQKESNRRNEIRELDNSIKIIENQRTEIETHFAKSSNIVPFLDTVEKLGGRAGAVAEVTSVNILPDGSGLTVGIKAAGSFENIYSFIMLLENSDYILEFMSSDITREGAADTTSKDTKAAKWNAAFNIKLLSFIK